MYSLDTVNKGVFSASFPLPAHRFYDIRSNNEPGIISLCAQAFSQALPPPTLINHDYYNTPNRDFEHKKALKYLRNTRKQYASFYRFGNVPIPMLMLRYGLDNTTIKKILIHEKRPLRTDDHSF
jgi:hypothetical protein